MARNTHNALAYNDKIQKCLRCKKESVETVFSIYVVP